MALVKELDSRLNYLANYRNARDIDSPRMEWVDRIVSVFIGWSYWLPGKAPAH